MEVGHTKRFFDAFCQVIGGTVKSLKKDAALQKLLFQFTSMQRHEPLLEASFWDSPSWKELSNAIGHRKSRICSSLQHVVLEIEFEEIPQEAQESVRAAIRGFVLQTAPDIDFLVTFCSPSSEG